jgi:hypothetical protein
LTNSFAVREQIPTVTIAVTAPSNAATHAAGAVERANRPVCW